MSDFAFKVNIVAVVQERAAEENVARKVVPTVLAGPGTTKIRLAKIAPFSNDTIVTNVNLLIEGGSIDLVESGEVAPACAPASAICSALGRK
jgi:hypothetical protein